MTFVRTDLTETDLDGLRKFAENGVTCVIDAMIDDRIMVTYTLGRSVHSGLPEIALVGLPADEAANLVISFLQIVDAVPFDHPYWDENFGEVPVNINDDGCYYVAQLAADCAASLPSVRAFGDGVEVQQCFWRRIGTDEVTQPVLCMPSLLNYWEQCGDVN